MKTRIIHTKMFSDEYYLSLSPIEKCVFYTLLINDKIGLGDIYEIPDIMLSLYTGVSVSGLRAIKVKFEKDGKFRFHRSYVQIMNAPKYQQFTGEKNDKAKQNEIDYLPKDVKKYFLEYPIDRVSSMHEPSDDTPNNHKSVTNNHKSVKGDVKGEEELKENKYESIEDLSQDDFEEVAEKYHVPIAFVLSKLDDVNMWAQQPRNKSKIKGRNWRLTLMDWVKRDAVKIRKEVNGQSKIAYVGEPLDT